MEDAMEYISAAEAAELWEISHRRVIVLCSEGRIPDAKMFGKMWAIPKNTSKPVDCRRREFMNDKNLKPFLKWAGGKGQLVEEISKRYPSELGKSIKRYAEPFIGGGAVLFDILNKYELEEIYISDINAELIHTYLAVRDDVDDLVELLLKYQTEYLPLSEDDRKTYFLGKRERFNVLKDKDNPPTELAALFIFLNRTCFNGLYRVNSRGKYNVPMGRYKRPIICDEENLRRVSDALDGVKIVCGEYSESRSFIDDKTFVYFDPPYRPLSGTSNFTSYTKSSFNDENQKELAEYIKELSQQGALVMASNADPKNTDLDDNFFDDLYAGLNINRILASRMINSNAQKRGKISELLICNY
jgi:DNA adenine methylase